MTSICIKMGESNKWLPGVARAYREGNSLVVEYPDEEERYHEADIVDVIA